MSEGILYLVGIGPGSLNEMTLRAREVLTSSDVVVGYETYVKLVKPLITGAEVFTTGMGGERERVLKALKEAGRGRRVALISSGDPGVYGLASLAITLNHLMGYGVRVEVVPGVTAALAAASLLGAPLNNDFAVISLSDYLTPWSEIVGDLRLLASTKLPIAIYNPSSSRRRAKFAEALELLRSVRGDEVPVGIVRNAYRHGQKVSVVRLGDLSPDEVDMDTLVIIGSERTVVLKDKLITIRGYPEELMIRRRGSWLR